MPRDATPARATCQAALAAPKDIAWWIIVDSGAVALIAGTGFYQRSSRGSALSGGCREKSCVIVCFRAVISQRSARGAPSCARTLSPVMAEEVRRRCAHAEATHA